MNQTLAVTLVCWAAVAGLWALGRAVTRPRGGTSMLLILMLWVAVAAWIVSGVASWALGDGPARPGVFAGYAATAVAMIPVGIPVAGKLSGRQADLARAVTLALVAFLCYRTEVVWLSAG